MLGPEAAGHLLTVLAFAEIPLTHVVVERNRKVMQEQQMLCFVFFQTVQERLTPAISRLSLAWCPGKTPVETNRSIFRSRKQGTVIFGDFWWNQPNGMGSAKSAINPPR